MVVLLFKATLGSFFWLSCSFNGVFFFNFYDFFIFFISFPLFHLKTNALFGYKNSPYSYIACFWIQFSPNFPFRSKKLFGNTRHFITLLAHLIYIALRDMTENERDKIKINTMIPHKKEFELWTINTKIKQLWTSVSKIRVSTFQRLLSAFLNILRSHNLKTIYISSILFLKIFMINYKFLHITDQSRGKKYTTVETFLMKIGKIFCHDLFRLKETKKIIPLLK